MVTLRILALGWLLIALIPTGPAYGRSNTNLFIILDCSNSMWAKAGGEHKITLAKMVLSDLLRGLPAETRVGLMAYGHRRKKDCRDVEFLAGIGSRSRPELMGMVKGLTPKGKTPISEALINSAAAFADHQKENNNLVLISDGIETCHGKPCKVAATLRKKLINLRIHVIGLDVDTKTENQLSCIAKAGAGKYLRADDAVSLAKALGAVTTKAANPPRALRLFHRVPEISSAEFKKVKENWVGYLRIGTDRWDTTPYRVAPAFTGQITIKPGQEVMLHSAKTGSGTGNWTVDQFLFFLAQAKGRKPTFFYCGNMPDIPIYFKGVRVPRVGPERHWFRPDTIKFENHFPKGTPFKLTVLALDIGVKGGVSDIWLVIR